MRHIIKVNNVLCDFKRFHPISRVIEIYSPFYGPASIHLDRGHCKSGTLVFKQNSNGRFKSNRVEL